MVFGLGSGRSGPDLGVRANLLFNNVEGAKRSARAIVREKCDVPREPRPIPWSHPQGCGLGGQANKRIRWMPWRPQATKDATACEKLRGAGKYALIRRSLNGETHPQGYRHPNPYGGEANPGN